MNSGINFLDPNDISSKRVGTRAKTVKYAKYEERLSPHIEDIKSRIEESNDGRAIISIKDLANILDMKDKHATTIYWGTKYVMWKFGIAVDSATHKDGESKLLIFREPTEGEKLPDSLAKYVEDEEVEPENEDLEFEEDEDPENEDPENEDPEKGESEEEDPEKGESEEEEPE